MLAAALLLFVLQSPIEGVLRQLHLRDLSGRAVPSAEFRGRVVVIDVWATWCAPCLADLPMLRELQDAHRNDLAIAGVSLDRMPARDFISWLRRHDVRWPQHFDGRGYASPAARHLDVETLPATLVFDRDGVLVARNIRGAALRSLVRTLTEIQPGARGGAR